MVRDGAQVEPHHRPLADRRGPAHPAGARALRRALAAGAEGHGPAREAPPTRAALLRRRVRLQRPAEHHRRRRAAGLPPLPWCRRRRLGRHVRLRRARAAERLAGPAPHHVLRAPHQPGPARAGAGQCGRRGSRRRHPRRARARAAHRRSPAPRRAIRQERRLDPLRRRGAPGGRPDARPPRGRPGRGAGRPRLPARARGSGADGGRRPRVRLARADPLAGIPPGRADRPGAAHRHLRARGARGRLRAVPHAARGPCRAGRRPRAGAVRAQPPGEPGRCSGVRRRGRRREALT